MNAAIPFLRPDLVRRSAYQGFLDRIDGTHLYSNYGPLNTEFESRVVAEYFQGTGAVTTVANATLGLMLAISEVKRPGARYAVMPSFTFAATPLAAQWCGLEPYFIDVHPGTWCMDPDAMEETLAKLGDDVAVVVPYAAFGMAMDLAPYREVHRRGIPVVVDAAPCFGTVDSDAGSPEAFGRGFPGLIVYSFHATKAFGIGEGGLVYGGTSDLIGRIRSAGNFGFSSARESVHQGLNAKMSEYAAAIALATLDGYPEKVQEHQRIHGWYLDALETLRGAGWDTQSYRGSVPWQFMSVLCPEGTREARMESLSGAAIEARTYFAPACHAQPQFSACPRSDLRVTEQLSRRIISLPLWEGMGRKDVDRVLQVLTK